MCFLRAELINYWEFLYIHHLSIVQAYANFSSDSFKVRLQTKSHKSFKCIKTMCGENIRLKQAIIVNQSAIRVAAPLEGRQPHSGQPQPNFGKPSSIDATFVTWETNQTERPVITKPLPYPPINCVILRPTLEFSNIGIGIRRCLF